MASGVVRNENQVYSLDETICGTWIDGSPIYRKTLLLPNGTYQISSDTTYDMTVSGIPTFSRIINAVFSIQDVGRSTHPYCNSLVFVFADKNNNKIGIKNMAVGLSLTLQGNNNYVTIEYLK